MVWLLSSLQAMAYLHAFQNSCQDIVPTNQEIYD